MAIFQKRACDLRVGDVLVARSVYSQRVVYHVHKAGDSVCPHTYPTGAASFQPPMAPEIYDGSMLVDVEVPDLIIERVELDVLLDAARDYVRLAESGDAGHIMDDTRRNMLETIIDSLRPPEPPTLAEALAALAEIRDMKNGVQSIGVERGRRVDALLERARRTGVLP